MRQGTVAYCFSFQGSSFKKKIISLKDKSYFVGIV